MVIYFGNAGLNDNIDLKHNSSIQREISLYRIPECDRIVWGKIWQRNKEQKLIRDSKTAAEIGRCRRQGYGKSRSYRGWITSANI